MTRETCRTFLLRAGVACAAALAPAVHAAPPRGVATPPRRSQEAAQQAPPAVERDQSGRVSVRLSRGGRVAVDNRTTGRITVVGWDKDFVEAAAKSDRGVEFVRASVSGDTPATLVSLTADYAPRDRVPMLIPPVKPGAPGETQSPEPRARPEPQPSVKSKIQDLVESIFETRPDEVHLEVRVPRYAEIDLITVNRSDVEVAGVETPVSVSGNRSAIKLSGVGAAEVRTGSGAVEISKVAGLVDVITSAGAVGVSHVDGDVRAVTISGEVRVRCVRGRVNITTANGSVALSGVSGDVDANTVNGEVRFAGALRADGRYHLKSMSGAVEMALQPNAPGFTALLSSYRGVVEDEFSLKAKASPQKPSEGRRILGSYGNGRAQITLDSFDGKVKLGKLAPQPPSECR